MQSRVEGAGSTNVGVTDIDPVERECSLIRGSEMAQVEAFSSPAGCVPDNRSRAGIDDVRTTATSRGSLNMAKVSILLLTKNGMPDITQCLKAIYDQCTTNPLEVIIVDSGSTDGTLAVARAFHVRLEQVPATSFHHARTRNFAASLASGEILIFLSQDAIPQSDRWLEAMVANFSDSSVGAVYGRQVPRPGSSLEREDALDVVYGDRKIVKDPAHRNGLGYRFYHFSDANSAMRRSVWESTCFPEDLKVFEDLGIAKRILDSGWKIVYEPEACVFHSHAHTTSDLFKRYFDIGYTLKILDIWGAPGTRKSMLRDVWKLLKSKVRRFNEKGARRSAGEGIRQDIAKSVGLFFGLHENYLPLVVKRRFSAFGVFE